ncbi:MAG TPA: EAL domain-containing protein [Stenomitos sp.]
MELTSIEAKRLQMLYQYQILDTLPEQHFDDLTRLVAYICEAPIAAISLIDAKRQWYKSKIGFDSCQEDRGSTFCNHAILQKDVFIIPDALEDPRFATNSFVVGNAQIRFYAGAPLLTPNGLALGTLCILDHRPRHLSAEQVDALGVIAKQVMTQLELRRNIFELKKNVEKRQHTEKELLYHVCHDSLTGMPNRTLLIEHLKEALAQFRQQDQTLFAVLFLDLDRFKIVNDSLGHGIGDKLLIHAALRLKACLRSNDMLARLGGDEFVILLKDIKKLEDAIEIASRIQREISLPFKLDNFEVFTSLSIGIALSTPEYRNPEEILRDADTAMYRAKASGKAQYAVFNPEMYHSAVTLLHLENDLRRTIERQEFQLYYQPIVCLESSSLLGFEALIRWQHPTQGLLSPGEFIPVAEENGWVVPIGYWVISEACRQLGLWHQYYNNNRLTISVNLSSKQFLQPDLAHKIRVALSEHHLSPCHLKLEITETSLIADAEVVSSVIAQLRAFGIEIYMDDFGTGYSSLSYLHQLPVDAFKIDKSFVLGLSPGNENTKLVTTILTLARSFGIKAIAEGIETPQQLDVLLNLNCQYGQGYLFSQPLNREAAEMFLTTLVPHFTLTSLDSFPSQT